LEKRETLCLSETLNKQQQSHIWLSWSHNERVSSINVAYVFPLSLRGRHVQASRITCETLNK
jgi:hypothetical protein